MIFFSISLGILYAILLIYLSFAWKKYFLSPQKINFRNNTMISVIICCRNEIENLPELLKSLNNQSLTNEKYEIIVVDDHSTDQSYQYLYENTKDYTNFRILKQDENLQGKKLAFLKGIHHSNGNFIVTTDADCIVSNNWLLCIYNQLISTNNQMILAPVFYKINEKKQIFSSVLALENLSLQALTASMCILKRPIMSNGANMGFSKINEADINLKVPTGDDIFRLIWYKKEIGTENIIYLKDKECYVETDSPKTWQEFMNQRLRWASKTRQIKDKDVLGIGIFFSLINTTLAILPILSFLDKEYVMSYILLLTLKMIGDYSLIFSFSAFYNKTKVLNYFILVTIIYPYYFIIFAFLSQIRKYRWKGR